jgi:hypothetical protein
MDILIGLGLFLAGFVLGAITVGWLVVRASGNELTVSKDQILPDGVNAPWRT